MKKCLALGVILLLIFVFAGCDQGPSTGPEEEYTLEISAVGNGTVTVDGEEIGDGDESTFTYDETTTLDLDVNPDDDHVARWSGDTENITDEGKVLVDGDISLTVEFYNPLEINKSIDAGQVKRTAAVTDDDMVIVPGGDTLLALNKDTMEEEWNYYAGAEITTSPLVDEDGDIYIGTQEEVIALTGEGEEKWEENPDIGNFSNTDSGFALVLEDESDSGDSEIIVGSDDNNLYAVDAEDGTKSWEDNVKASVLNNPVVDSERGEVYVAAEDKVVAYDLDEEEEKKREWIVDKDDIDVGDFNISESSPAVGEDMLYVASYEGTLYALDLENDGEVEWSYNTEGKISASPVIDENETVYLGSGSNNGEGVFQAVSEGEKDWSMDIDASVTTTAAVTEDGKVYFGDSNRVFYMADADTGDIEKIQKLDGLTGSGVAVDDDGTIYVGSYENSEESTFYSLAGDSGLADSLWPKMGADLGNTSRK